MAQQSQRRRWVTAALITLTVVWLTATPAAAHTGFESSSPADGAVIGEPVTEITLTFSGEATPAGEGFVVLDPLGNVREPDDVSSSDNLTWTLQFAEPLAGGDVGVRWMVAAPDAHPIDGSFSFTVSAPDPLPESPTDVESAVDVEIPAEGPAEPATEEPSVPAAEERPDIGQTEVTPEEGEGNSSVPVIDLDTFLETDVNEPVAASSLATLARIVSFVGAVLAIGGASFAAFGLRGSRADVRAVLFWVRRGGVLVVIGALFEATALVVSLAGGWSGLISPSEVSAALWSSTGFAIALRLAGGVLVASKTSLSTAPAATMADPVLAARQLATVGAAHAEPPAERASDEPFVYPEDHVWNHTVVVAALGGLAMIAIAFAFDGHTASEGPRWIHAIVNLVHVTTAATWAGGVAMLAYVMWRRHRRNEDTQALQLAMRFSVVATIALVVAALAGFVLSVIVVDSISDIWSTPWGRLLMLKVALVAIAAAGGGYNHRVMVPALDRASSDPTAIDRFRTIVALEALILVGVTVVTALLVGASAI